MLQRGFGVLLASRSGILLPRRIRALLLCFSSSLVLLCLSSLCLSSLCLSSLLAFEVGKLLLPRPYVTSRLLFSIKFFKATLSIRFVVNFFLCLGVLLSAKLSETE